MRNKHIAYCTHVMHTTPRLLWRPTRVLHATSTLDCLLQHTGRNASRIQLPELFKLGVLLKDANDVLGLREHPLLLSGLARRYGELRSQATPFQTTLLDSVLNTPPAGGTQGSVSPASSADTSTVASTAKAHAGGAAPTITAQDYYKAIMAIAQEVEAEHHQSGAPASGAKQTTAPSSSSSSSSALEGVRETHSRGRGFGRGEKQAADQVSLVTPEQTAKATTVSTSHLGEMLGAARAASLQGHLTALEPLLRQLSPKETTRLIKALAKLNYTHYGHALLLTRRGCEVASQLQRHDLCVLFFNLHRLHTRDSLAPIVNRILEHTVELTAEEVYLLCQALERQESSSNASQRLVTPLVAQAVRKLPDATSSAYHRALLVAMARYHVQQPATVKAILHDWVARWKLTSSEKDVLVLLEAATTLAAPGTETEGLQELIDRLTFLAPSMDMRHIDRVMDLLSAVPMHMSAACMKVLLTRLENEAGSLSVGQLTFVLHLLSTYPPAKGQVATVSLAYACALRARAMDAETLESIVVSLAMLQLFTDDFYAIAHVLQMQKGGMRSFEQVKVLFECCTAEMAGQPQGLGLLSSVVCTIAPALSDEELSYCRKALVKLGVTDRDVLQKIFMQAKRAQRSTNVKSSRKPRGGYRDPMEDLL